MNRINFETAEKLKLYSYSFANNLLEKHLTLSPAMGQKYGERQKHHYIEDTIFHLSYLSEAIRNNQPVLFNEYLSWAKIFFANLPVTEEEIITNLELLRDEIAAGIPSEMSNITDQFINNGIDHFKKSAAGITSFITDKNPLKEIAAQYLYYLIEGDRKSAYELIMSMVREIPVRDLYLYVFQITQKETGRLWQTGEITVAHEHFITGATQLIMAQLYPYFMVPSAKKNKIIVSCVEGELHEIGARMVADIFEMEGWNSYYFGANTPAGSLISSIRTYRPEVVAISATMTFNISAVARLIEEIKKYSGYGGIKILVGGYPFLLAGGLWSDIGADGFAADAMQAVELAGELIN